MENIEHIQNAIVGISQLVKKKEAHIERIESSLQMNKTVYVGQKSPEEIAQNIERLEGNLKLHSQLLEELKSSLAHFEELV